jgi:hypothetical protein
MDLPPSKSLSPSAIKKKTGTLVILCTLVSHVAHKSLDFQRPPLPVALVIDLPPFKGGERYEPLRTVFTSTLTGRPPLQRYKVGNPLPGPLEGVGPAI